MLTALKGFIRFLIPPALYAATIGTCLATIFKRAEWGLFLLVAMIPQPNVWYKLHEYPMGNNFIDVLFFSVLLGMLIQQKGFSKTPNSTYILLFIGVSYISVWNSSMRFSLPLPVSTDNRLIADWKNYIQMICLYFLVLNIVKGEEQQKNLVLVMSAVILLLGIRSYRNFEGGSAFNYEKRVGGPFETVGLGANHFGAFIVDYCAVFLGLFFFEKDKKRRLLYAATFLFGLHPLFFSYSRGVYLAALGVVTFFGLLKKRSLLVLVGVLFFAWQTLLPPSVVDRIQMTEDPNGQLEHSAGGRILLWEHALDLFHQHPVFGIGYNGYSMSTRGVYLENGEELNANQDVHSYYMRTLSETGLIGIALYLLLLLKAMHSGWTLYRIGDSAFRTGLGFGFMGCVLAMAVTNLFGDRWSYFALGGYFWVFLALVDRSVLSVKHRQRQAATDKLETIERQPQLVESA